MWNHDGTMIFGGGLMWIFWILLIVVLVVVIKSLSNNGTGGESAETESPMAILKKRYARGEIDEEEFERKRKKLES